MEPIIDDMLDGYEKGRLSRRALVQGLTALAMAAAATPSAIRGVKAAEEAASPLKATNVDHVSILTEDLQGSIDFYKSVFGFNELSADKEHKIMRMGPGKKIILSLRQQEPYGKVDHFGFRVEGFREKSGGRDELPQGQGAGAEDGLGIRLSLPRSERRGGAAGLSGRGTMPGEACKTGSPLVVIPAKAGIPARLAVPGFPLSRE